MQLGLQCVRKAQTEQDHSLCRREGSRYEGEAPLPSGAAELYTCTKGIL